MPIKNFYCLKETDVFTCKCVFFLYIPLPFSYSVVEMEKDIPIYDLSVCLGMVSEWHYKSSRLSFQQKKQY